MKKLLLASLILLSVSCVYAQRQNFMYPDKESMQYFNKIKFANSEFYPGIVVSKDGKLSGGKMNICTIDQKIHFINEQGDTLVIKNNENVQTASIVGKSYLNSKYGYVRLIENAGDISIGELCLLEVHTDAPVGAYGLRYQTAAVKKLTTTTITFNSADGAEPLSSITKYNEKDTEYPFSYHKKPFLIVNGEVYPATKKTFTKYFPGKRNFIEEYTKEHNTNFNSVAPVIALFQAVNAK